MLPSFLDEQLILFHLLPTFLSSLSSWNITFHLNHLWTIVNDITIWYLLPFILPPEAILRRRCRCKSLLCKEKRPDNTSVHWKVDHASEFKGSIFYQASKKKGVAQLEKETYVFFLPHCTSQAWGAPFLWRPCVKWREVFWARNTPLAWSQISECPPKSNSHLLPASRARTGECLPPLCLFRVLRFPDSKEIAAIVESGLGARRVGLKLLSIRQ